MKAVAAVILTYNDPIALASCLTAVLRQSHPPDLIVVIDNASTPRVTLPEGDVPIDLLRAEVNGGPAGGFADGLEHFLTTPMDFAWVMDDDCVPTDEALATLLTDCDSRAIVIPELISSGHPRHMPAWCGVLIPREIVEAVGVPRRDFVWWAEDTEYLQWRIPHGNFEVRESTAVVVSDHPRRSGAKPAWKYYYEARNATYLRLYLKRSHRARRMGRILFRIPIGILISGNQRWSCLWMHTRGISDGLSKRLGMRVPLE